MEITAENMIQSPTTELLEIYRKARRLYAEKKFARDSEASRLEWQSARLFATTPGRFTERQNAVRTSELLAKKSHLVREMTLELDLLKADIDVLAWALKIRGGVGPCANEDVEEEPRAA